VKIRLLVLDVDGVLTDGTFWLLGATEETKAFHSADGLGLRLLMDAGVKVAFLTGRDSRAVERRAAELGIDELIAGRKDKREALTELCGRLGVELSEVAYMGDDLVDLPAMGACGFAAAPSDARPEVIDAAQWIAPSTGGRGAVRDLSEHLLKARRRALSSERGGPGDTGASRPRPPC
jgi:3-deoxy-D-manno-octulosonate 8-phosphate phosphatase (KDO 8-P phosphatase)